MIVARCAQLGDQREEVAPALRVERADGLVEDQQAGLGDERLGDPEPLAHPARVAGDPAVGGIGEADLLEGGIGACPRVARLEPLQPPGQGDQLAAGHPAVVAGVLVEDPDRPPRARIARIDPRAVDRRLAGGRRGKSRDEP